MALDEFVRPWMGAAYRHVPDRAPFDVLDFRHAGLRPGNRWNVRGERTLYLAGDRGVALAEFARHYEEEHAADPARSVQRRAVFRLGVRLDALLDLLDPAVLDQLPLADPPAAFLDIAVCRAVAGRVRATTAAQAIRVPSIAFLDDPQRWNLVVFLDKAPRDHKVWIRSVRRAGSFEV